MDISVYVLTYFHENYIAQAIESILSQKTKYTYEIVVSDDCSQDRTLDILREYQAKYPDIIRVLTNETNTGIPQNIFKARCSCRGKYIVGLSGDDYWINDNKLELQANFLEEHPEYLCVCAFAEQRYDDEVHATTVLPDRRQGNREYTIKDYEKNHLFGYSYMMRNLFLTEEGRKYFGVARSISDRIDDVVDELLILKKGRVYTLPEVAYAYRAIRNKQNKHSYNARYSRIEKAKNHINMLNNMRVYFGDTVDLSNRYVRCLSISYLTILMYGGRREYREIFEMVPEELRSPLWKNVFFRAVLYLPKVGFELVKRRI